MNSSTSNSKTSLRWNGVLFRGALYLFLLLACDRVLASWLTTGITRYYGFHRNPAVLVIGHSRSMMGLDIPILEQFWGEPVAKFTANGADTFARAAMVRAFLNEHPEVKWVIYDVETASFNSSALSANAYRLFVPLLKFPAIRDYVRLNLDSSARFAMLHALHLARFEELSLNLAVRGWLRSDANLKSGRFDPDLFALKAADGRVRSSRIDPENLRTFRETLKFCRERGCEVILLEMPQVDLLNRLYGAERERVQLVFQEAAREPGIRYLDFSRWRESDYSLFRDDIHLNAVGKEEFSREVARALAIANP